MNCPSCWAKIDIEPWMVNYVCPYCKNVLMFEHEKLETTWEKSEIVPYPTTFEYWKIFYVIEEKNSNDIMLWKNVEYISEKDFNDKKLTKFLTKFYVYGQIRYVNEASMYNKFFLRILDDKIWLDKNKKLFAEEDEGQIKLYYLDIVEKDGSFDKIFSSDKEFVDWFFVQEKWIQNIEWFLWWFDFEIINVKQTRYLNLIWNWWKNILLEEYPNNILYGEGI